MLRFRSKQNSLNALDPAKRSDEFQSRQGGQTHYSGFDIERSQPSDLGKTGVVASGGVLMFTARSVAFMRDMNQ